MWTLLLFVFEHALAILAVWLVLCLGLVLAIYRWGRYLDGEQ